MDMESAENPNPDSYASPRGLTLKAPSRTGYLFGGWYLDEHYREKITSVAIGTRGELTLYPKWTAISYTLSFSANGGSGSASRRRLSYGMETTLPDSGFRHKGYTLAGWNTAKDGTGDAYLPGQTVRDLKETNKASLTLYAQWAAWSSESDFQAENGKILAYTGSEERIVIPESIGGETVTAIAEGAFTDCTAQEIIFPKTLETVESGLVMRLPRPICSPDPSGSVFQATRLYPGRSKATGAVLGRT